MEGHSRRGSPEEDVAAAMGFGSFGTKPHLNKKRKTEPSNEPGSGSNSIPLGLTKERHTSRGEQTQSKTILRNASTHAVGQAPSRSLHMPEVVPRHLGLPNRPPSPEHMDQGVKDMGNIGEDETGKLANGKWDWNALRKGVRDEHGDTAYYDASFVEDPWAALKSKG